MGTLTCLRGFARVAPYSDLAIHSLTLRIGCNDPYETTRWRLLLRLDATGRTLKSKTRPHARLAGHLGRAERTLNQLLQVTTSQKQSTKKMWLNLRASAIGYR